jgi:hypothetical protein
MKPQGCSASMNARSSAFSVVPAIPVMKALVIWCLGSDIRMLPRWVRLRMSEPKRHQQIWISSGVLDLAFAMRTRGDGLANAKSTH